MHKSNLGGLNYMWATRVGLVSLNKRIKIIACGKMGGNFMYEF